MTFSIWKRKKYKFSGGYREEVFLKKKSTLTLKSSIGPFGWPSALVT